MKVTDTTIPIKKYCSVNHEDSADCFFYVSPEAARITAPLRCTLTSKDLPQRDDQYSVDPDLSMAFESACQGKNDRWRLLCINISHVNLRLDFVDLTKFDDRCGYDGETVVFDGTLNFYAYAERPSNHYPDEYMIDYFGSVTEDGDRVATIEEHRNSKYYILESIDFKNGKCYLNTYRFDYVIQKLNRV